MMMRKWTPELDEQLLHYYNQGYGQRRIAAAMGWQRRTIRTKMAALGLAAQTKRVRTERIERKARIFFPPDLDWGRLIELFERDIHPCAGGCGQQTRFHRCTSCRNKQRHRKPDKRIA